MLQIVPIAKSSSLIRNFVTLTGQQTVHRAPGVSLKTVAVYFHPWNPQIFDQNSENSNCCWNTVNGMAFEQNMLVKIGCPPGRRLQFDTGKSLDILIARGQTHDFQHVTDSSNNLPCFSTTEFAAAFYIEDLVTGSRKPFEGNYTLRIVGGGVGYLHNIVEYTKEEIENYNYKPSVGGNLQTLIWNVHSESSGEGLIDESTGQLIFDAKNPSSIAFECRLDSPCGNIPFGSANPGEFYLKIEASNKGVDSSTNCDYTMTFVIRLIGTELSPRVHLGIMLTTLSCIFIAAIIYYGCQYAEGHDWLKKITKITISESDSDSEYAEVRQQFRDAANRRKTHGHISSTSRNPKCDHITDKSTSPETRERSLPRRCEL